jgi:hypothetical protein
MRAHALNMRRLCALLLLTHGVRDGAARSATLAAAFSEDVLLERLPEAAGNCGA